MAPRPRPGMNWIFYGIVATAFLAAAFHQVLWEPPAGVLPVPPSPMEALQAALFSSAKGAVELAIGLVGAMTFFLGLMKVAEAGGLLAVVAKVIRPVMVRLFPDVPPDHPAMGAMILNMSANALGLANAATPFGIRAMQELDRLNRVKGTATNAMVLFLAINTSNVTLLPTGVIAIRDAVGSADPAGIMPTTLFATICSTAVAILAAKTLQRFSPVVGPPADGLPGDAPAAEAPEATPPGEAPLPTGESYPPWVSAMVLGPLVLLVPLLLVYGRRLAPHMTVVSAWLVPLLTVGLLTFGVVRRVRVYEVFVEGAKEGFQVAVRIIPYMVAILVAVGMFRASGALELLVGLLEPVTGRFNLPGEALPMALLRPLSGSGAYAVMTSIIEDPAVGPDSYTGYLVSTFQGSTETTFYVLAVYFGAVSVRNSRHAMPAALLADVTGVAAAVVICSMLFL